MTQEQVLEVLRKNARRDMTITEIAQQASLNYRNASRNLQDLSKWRIVEVHSQASVKRYRIKR